VNGVYQFILRTLFLNFCVYLIGLNFLNLQFMEIMYLKSKFDWSYESQIWQINCIEISQNSVYWTKLDVSASALFSEMSIIIVSGPCDFQNGLCGLRNDVNSEFQWTTDIGPTPSETRRPSFDHSTLSNQGNLLQSYGLNFWKNIWHSGLIFTGKNSIES